MLSPQNQEDLTASRALHCDAAVDVASQRHTWIVWGGGGFLLLGLFVFTAILSQRFTCDVDAAGQPTLLVVGLLVAAGIIYVGVVASIPHTAGSRSLIIFVIVVGALARFALISSLPIHEDDFYRYLWDGAVTTHARNPYVYAPDQILDGEDESLHEIATSGAAAEMTMDRINHSDLRTIYPPVAQAAFALAYVLKPWSLLAWRLVLTVVDAAVLLLLAAILRRLGLPLLYLSIYWLNPVLIKEVYNSAHMDVLVLPFVLGAILFYLKRSYVWAAGLLALGVGVKVWPILLLPLILRPVFRKPRYLIPALILFGLIVTVLLIPIYSAGSGENSGFAKYSRSWEMNDAFFMIIKRTVGFFIEHTGLHISEALAARGIVICFLAIFVASLSWKQPGADIEILKRSLYVIAALFLLSPAQFPWYYIWMLPFLAVQPRFSLLVMTALLPLYYLRFFFDSYGRVFIFDEGIVWLEHSPVWILMVREWMKGRGVFTGSADANEIAL